MKKRQGMLGWLSAGRDAMGQKETEIAPTRRTLTDYDLVIIGQPIWAGNPTPAIRTYLNKNDLSGKKAALFFSDAGSGQALEKTKALMPNATFVGELTLSAKELKNKEETKKKIVEWCNTLKTA
jgi:flavodoxin